MLKQQFDDTLRAALPRIDLIADQISTLFRHFETLQRWNARMNLTSIRTADELVVRHYGESLFLAAHLPLSISDQTLADVGSGPGFPGVPLAVYFPQLHVTLIESNQRKAVFLKESTRGLPNVSVAAQRAQSVSRPFSWIVARAVDPTEVIDLVPSLACKLALLIGSEDAAKLPARIQWRDPVPLPWGDRRVCVFGECST